MIFNRSTGKICGIVVNDPLEDTDNFCCSSRGAHSFVTPWEEIFFKCYVVCPD